jgi:hypothetical protein
MTDARRNLVVSLVACTLALGYLIWAESYPAERAQVPRLIAWVTLILAALDVLAHTETGFGRRIAAMLSGRAHRDAVESIRITREEFLSVAWMGASLAAIVVLGFLAGIFVYVAGYMIVHGRLGWRLGLYVAGGTVLSCWLVFDELLKVGLYRGLFFEG